MFQINRKDALKISQEFARQSPYGSALRKGVLVYTDTHTHLKKF